MLGQGACQTFHRPVGHQAHPYPARVLQPGSEEVDSLAFTIAELHFHLPKIVLTELSGKTFEAHQRLQRLRAKRGHQHVERGLASFVAACLSSTKNL